MQTLLRSAKPTAVPAGCPRPECRPPPCAQRQQTCGRSPRWHRAAPVPAPAAGCCRQSQCQYLRPAFRPAAPPSAGSYWCQAGHPAGSPRPAAAPGLQRHRCTMPEHTAPRPAPGFRYSRAVPRRHPPARAARSAADGWCPWAFLKDNPCPAVPAFQPYPFCHRG